MDCIYIVTLGTQWVLRGCLLSYECPPHTALVLLELEVWLTGRALAEGCVGGPGLDQIGEHWKEGAGERKGKGFILKDSGVEEWDPREKETGVCGSVRGSHTLGAFS